MKLIYKLYLFLLLIMSCSSSKTMDFSISESQWKEDLQYLKTTISTKHLNPYHSISKEKLELSFQKAMMELGNADSIQSVLILAEFAALIGDGHTYVNPYQKLFRFPLWLNWFEGKLKINVIDTTFKDYQGLEITRIGNHTTKQALAVISKLIPKGESINLIKNHSSFYLTHGEILYALGISDNPNSLKLTVVNNEDSLIDFTIHKKPIDVYNGVTREFKNDLPLRFSNNDPLWYKKIENSEVGYFNFSRYPTILKSKTFGRAMNKWLKKGKIKALIVDFRANGGGDFTKGRRILKAIKKTILKQNIDVYIAIGGVTFSAGMSNASDFKNALNGTFIGQISGARPNGYQENNDFTLPNSKIPCSYSSEYYVFSSENTPGIIPEIYIEYKWEDYHLGIDPLINWVTNKYNREL